MKTFSMRRNKKGVSPIIATLLLIVIAVAAAVVTYAFVTGFIGTATSQSNQQGALSVDTGNVVAWTNGTTGSTITVYVRNTGTKSENLTSVYVDNALMGAPNTVTFNGAAFASIAPNAVCTVIVSSTTNWANAAAHLVKVLATDGTPVAYSVHS